MIRPLTPSGAPSCPCSSVGVNGSGGGGGGGGGKGGSSTIRQVMERAMLTAVADQMGLSEDDPSVREVFERESRLMGGGGGSGGGATG